MPTSNQHDEGMEKVYDDLNAVLKDVKGNNNLSVMGNWIATVKNEKKVRL